MLDHNASQRFSGSQINQFHDSSVLSYINSKKSGILALSNINTQNFPGNPTLSNINNQKFPGNPALSNVNNQILQKHSCKQYF